MRKLFYNAQILDLHSGVSKAKALVVENGKIVETSPSLSPEQGHWDESRDLQGQILIPGLNDAHIHVWKVGSLRTHLLDLRGTQSIVSLKEKLQAFAQGKASSTWLTGRGFNELSLAEGRMPTRQDLDAVVPDHPVMLIRTCAHIAVANSKALALAGIKSHTSAPAGGSIDWENGTFAETALGLLFAAIPAYSQEDYKQMILAAQQQMLSYGITSATDPAVHPELTESYLALAQSREMAIRMNLMAIRVPDGASEALPLPTQIHMDRLKLDTVKFFSDGGLSGQTAALTRPYLNSESRGILRLEAEAFKAWALASQHHGFQIGTHAIGDEAIQLVLDTYQQLKPHHTRMRHRIEHLGLPSPEQLSQMAEVEAFAVPQSIFLYELGANFRKYIDEDYLARCYPLRSVLDAGISLALSSDAPVVKDLNPFKGMQAALQRVDRSGHVIAPQERISLSEALLAYTTGGAEASGDLHNRATLEVGKWADFAVLAQNPLELELEELDQVQVQQTFIAGEEVYRV